MEAYTRETEMDSNDHAEVNGIDADAPVLPENHIRP
jgi:hypothetical protein